MGSLDGKRVIITGAAGGIGSAAVEAFVREGARVACTYSSTEPSLPDGVVTSDRCDITSKASVDSVFDRFAETLGGLDVLVQAAGLHGSCPADQLTEEYWDNMFALNGKATLLTNQAAFRHMRDIGGSIVNMGSCEGVRGFAGNACYAATRGAVHSWTRSVALEWGQYKIRVNALAPVAETEPAKRMRANQDAATNAMMDAYLQQAIPLGGKMGDALNDIAPALVFLASDASHFITGQTLAVDGGFMMLGS
jgi:NAD(P)-dependent dehydrogenase (short-subunit alcohol dehydrogenase family)